MKKNTPCPTTIDFETFGIEGRPDYPPRPVGVSIKPWGKKARYYAFGHSTKNNCTEDQAKKAVLKAYQCKEGVLFQNAKFDIDVAESWFSELKIPEWSRIHDTMFLLFLEDPHQKQLDLKSSAERLLYLKPEEQDKVRDWLIKNQPTKGVKISSSKNSPHYFGRYIAHAPGDIVGEYANGDVERTEMLFYYLYPKILESGMLGAYKREQRLMPILLQMERQGLPIDVAKLKSDIFRYSQWADKIDKWIIKRIKASFIINLDSGAQLMEAMIRCGAADPEKVPLTPTGKYQTNKDALLVGVQDKQLVAVLKYRSQLKTCLNTFMVPWLKVAEKSEGFIYTTWNQVKLPSGSGSIGTRTGRLSSTPNFQNIPNAFNPIFGGELPEPPFDNLPDLPRIRSYITPFKGDVLIDRDFSQQELRILAHCDGAELQKKYNADPWIDFHEYTQQELSNRGYVYERKPVKVTNFGLLYGMGVGKMAEAIGTSKEDAKVLKTAILNLYPGLQGMYKEMKIRAHQTKPIRTFGGRLYYCEPDKFINGQWVKFDYKMVNVLIQGSAADCTKEALIRFAEVKKEDWKIILNVHDQITVSVPEKDIDEAMEALRKAMESIELDVPLLSEGSVSSTNWSELQDYDKKGKKLEVSKVA